MKSPSVAIILSNYKGASIKYKGISILERCLKTMYQKTKYDNYRVIVADDNSGDGSAELVKRVAPKAEFMVNMNCRSFSRNNNRSIEYALKKYKPEYFLLLNYDTIINDSNWLSSIVEIAETDKNIGAVSPNLVYPDGTNQGAFGMRFYDRFSLRNLGKPDVDMEFFEKPAVRDAEVMPGVALLIRSNVVKKIGLLDENFLGGYEDVDYDLRIRNAGMRIVYDGRAKIIHLQGYMQKADPSEEYKRKITYSIRRNQFYFLRKYKDQAGYLRFLAWHLVYFGSTIETVTRQRKLPFVDWGIALSGFNDAQKLPLPAR